MKLIPLLISALICPASFAVSVGAATDTASAMPPEKQAQANLQRKVKPGPDDVRAFPDASKGFDAPGDNIPHGTVQLFEYETKITGKRRKANDHLPPDFRETWR